jgi:cytochrome b6-f complex iron-sulfur subunit
MADRIDKPEGHLIRRDFLSKVFAIWGTLSFLPIIAVVLKYISPVERREPTAEVIEVGTISELKTNSAKIVRFNREPVILVRTSSDQFRAFSARCTHLGCVVQFEPTDIPHFACNCHGSQFDINGKNIAGPAPRPLVPMKVTLRQSNIYVSKV